MTLNLLLLVLLVGGIIGAGFIVVRKFPQLTLIDAESLPQERDAKIQDEREGNNGGCRPSAWPECF